MRQFRPNTSGRGRSAKPLAWGGWDASRRPRTCGQLKLSTPRTAVRTRKSMSQRSGVTSVRPLMCDDAVARDIGPCNHGRRPGVSDGGFTLRRATAPIAQIRGSPIIMPNCAAKRGRSLRGSRGERSFLRWRRRAQVRTEPTRTSAYTDARRAELVSRIEGGRGQRRASARRNPSHHRRRQSWRHLRRPRQRHADLHRLLGRIGQLGKPARRQEGAVRAARG